VARASQAGNHARRPDAPRLVPNAGIAAFGHQIIRIIEFRRYARQVRLLEVERADGDLVLFSRWDLGTDPLDVLDALTAAGYAGGPQR